MTKIKIRSNPYNREISYLTMDEATGQWVDVRETDERSRLRETDSERSFLPFKIKEIITIIIKEYYVGREKVQLYFEGTQDEYYEVEAVCESDDVKDKIELIRTNTILENARFIKGDIKEVFERVNPVIENIMKEDFSVKRGLNKVSQALDDVMYASGIFFVSSIMGLGGKNDGEFVDRFYRKTFRTQSPTFSDPEDIDYMSLYKYNIMPAQVKQNALDYCQKNENLIYVNSGLYCIEKEIENFASKHSSYNKCQMVLAFLSNVIDKTNARIDERTKVLKDARDRSTQELDAKTVRLQEEIDRSSKSMEEANGRTSKSDVGEYALSKLNYSFDATQLANMDADRRKQNFEENDFASKTKDYQEAKDKFWEHLKESSQGLFKRNIVDSVKTIANDLSSDFKDVQHSKDKMDAKEKELDQLSSEQILKYVINSYKVNIDDAQEKLSMHLDEYWRKKELDFKRALILQITNTDALSDSQREEIADMIQNYDVNNFKEQADSVFVRKRFLKGNLLGIRINDDEKLDIKACKCLCGTFK